MGAGRLSPYVRETLSAIANAEESRFRATDGSIDRKGLSAAILRAVRGNVALYSALTAEARELAVDSFLADRYRDRRSKVTIAGRKTSIRQTMSVPMDGGKWITKGINDLTPEDMERIERHTHAEAMTRLKAAKDIRILRGFETSNATQIEMIAADEEGVQDES